MPTWQSKPNNNSKHSLKRSDTSQDDMLVLADAGTLDNKNTIERPQLSTSVARFGRIPNNDPSFIEAITQ